MELIVLKKWVCCYITSNSTILGFYLNLNGLYTLGFNSVFCDNTIDILCN